LGRARGLAAHLLGIPAFRAFQAGTRPFGPLEHEVRTDRRPQRTRHEAFLLDLITNDSGLLEKYLEDRNGVVANADLTKRVKNAFAALPRENDLRFQIQNTQGFKGVGPVKKAAKRKAAAKKKPAAKNAPARKVAKGGRKR